MSGCVQSQTWRSEEDADLETLQHICTSSEEEEQRAPGHHAWHAGDSKHLETPGNTWKHLETPVKTCRNRREERPKKSESFDLKSVEIQHICWWN